jgi:2-phosphosulfolactate phosphatase
MKLEVILSPKELPALAKRDLRDAVCVVFDVLRATSTFVTALHHGAAAIVPVSEIAEALAVRRQQPDVLLGGERDGVKIRAARAGDIDFDLGNSPREYAPERVRGKTIVSTTTNGTRALRACAGAKRVLAASFLNLAATTKCVCDLQAKELLLVCAGTGENIADEDVLAAGAFCELWLNSPPMHPGAPASRRRVENEPKEHAGETPALPGASANDPVATALDAWRHAKSDLFAAVAEAENARRLLAIPELRDDVAFCLQRDAFHLAAALDADGAIRVSI